MRIENKQIYRIKAERTLVTFDQMSVSHVFSGVAAIVIKADKIDWKK